MKIVRVVGSAVSLGLLLASPALLSPAAGQALIIDHACADIRQIPESAITNAKQSLHIAYGHTSHGSQLTTGMSGLVGFMNGLGYPTDLYAWNSGGSDGALDLRDSPFSGASDLGNPDRTSWAAATRTYLDGHPTVNVIIWSWCGQVSSATEADIGTYLSLMNALEADYPSVRFVYMTGHLDGSGPAENLHLRNEQIRAYCVANGKTLYDFADIESYDPDGAVNYMNLRADDNCDYDGDGNGSRESNWAIGWQTNHTLNVDWYTCSAAHSQPLNGNRKAYAAWWLWARLGGWAGPNPDTTPPSPPDGLHATTVTPVLVSLAWQAGADAESGISHYRVYRDGAYRGQTAGLSYNDTTVVPGTGYAYRVSAVNGAGLESAATDELTVNTPADPEPPAPPTGLQAQTLSSTSIGLQWQAATDNVAVAYYRIYRNGALVGQTNATAFTDTGLDPSTDYTYRVSAVDAAGHESPPSDSATARTSDPSVETHTVRLEGATPIVDAFLSSSSSNTNYGSTQYVSTFERFLLQFSLPPEVLNRRIVSARIGLYVWNQTDYQAGQFLDLYRVTRAWVEGETTWVRATAATNWTTPGGDFAERVARIEHQTTWDHVYYPPADVTLLVQKWVCGTVPNCGVMVVRSPITDIGLKASEYSHGPYLEITYTDEPAPSLYEMWQHAHFTDTELADPDLEHTVWGRGADADHDGLCNLFEYALKMPPRTGDPAGIRIGGNEGSAGLPGLGYTRACGALGVGFGIDHSSNLTDWMPIDPQSLVQRVTNLGGGVERVDIDITPLPGQSVDFFRLRLDAL